MLLMSNKEKFQKRDSTIAGNPAALSEGSLTGIHLPNLEELEDSRAVRLRKRLNTDICRCKNRMKGQLNRIT